jgi:tetratricopeptide (TPR) repeat protein
VAEPAPAATPATAPIESDIVTCAAALREAREVTAGDAERTSYEAALAAERADDWVSARKSYFELITKYPRSELVPLAYLAFAELFARETERDSTKLDLAKAAYDQVVRYPPPKNTAYAYSLLREADVEPDPQHALAGFSKAIDATTRYPALPCAKLVRARAVAGSIRTYTEVGRPDRAAAFFRAKLEPAEVESAIAMLADEYVRIGKMSEACSVLRGAKSMPTFVEKRRKICGK